MSMIEFVRRRKKGIVNFILLGLAVILMVSFGLDTFLIQGPREDYAIKIDNEEITQRDYQQKLRSMEQLYSSQLKEMYEQIRATLNLPQKIADQMIEEKLLSRFLNSLGLSASQAQIEGRIAQLPYFAGKVDHSSYLSYLQATGMSESSMISSITKEIIEGELNQAFIHLSPLSEEELKGIFYRENQQARFIAAKFVPQAKESTTVPDAEVQKYYDEHKSDFITPKEISLEYLLISAKKYLDKVPVLESDLKQLYDEKRSQFIEPEKVLLSKITFLKNPNLPTENITNANDKKQQLAQSVIDRVKKGEDFGQLARELSEDNESKARGGELGWRRIDELETSLSSTLKNLGVGETSGIIEDDKEFSVYLINQKQAEKELPFDDVKEKLIAELRAADAPLYLEIEAEKLFSKAQDGNLNDFAKREGLEYNSVKHINTLSSVLPKNLRDDALNSDTGILKSLSTEEGVFFYKVIDSTLEHPKPLIEVRGEIIANLQQIAARRIAKTKAEEFLKASSSIRSEQEFKQAVNNTKAEVMETSLKPLQEQQAPFAKDTDEMFQLYALNSSQPIYNKVLENGEDSYVVLLVERKEPDLGEYTKKRNEIISSEAQKTGTRLLDSLVAALRSNSKIEINPEILQNG